MERNGVSSVVWHLSWRHWAFLTSLGLSDVTRTTFPLNYLLTFACFATPCALPFCASLYRSALCKFCVCVRTLQIIFLLNTWVSNLPPLLDLIKLVHTYVKAVIHSTDMLHIVVFALYYRFQQSYHAVILTVSMVNFSEYLNLPYLAV